MKPGFQIFGLVLYSNILFKMGKADQWLPLTYAAQLPQFQSSPRQTHDSGRIGAKSSSGNMKKKKESHPFKTVSIILREIDLACLYNKSKRQVGGGWSQSRDCQLVGWIAQGRRYSIKAQLKGFVLKGENPLIEREEKSLQQSFMATLPLCCQNFLSL